MRYKYKHHALQQYSSRAAIEPHYALFALDDVMHHKDTKEYTLAEVQDMGFNILYHKKGDKYMVWYNDKIKEKMCAIVRDGNVVITVLTQHMYSWHSKKTKLSRAKAIRGFEI